MMMRLHLPVVLPFLIVTGCTPLVTPQLKQIRGNIAQNDISIRMPFATNPVIQAFNDLGQAAGHDRSKRYIAVSKHPLIQAGSVGDHHFLVSWPLLQSTDPCLIWGIVAHEIAHDLLGHSEKLAGAQVATSQVAVPLHPAALILVPAQILARQMILSSYGRSHEQEADERALELLQKAGKPPGVMRYGLEFMREAHGNTGGGWFSTHPATSERITSLPVLDRGKLCASPDKRQAAIEAERAVAKRLKEAEERKKQDAPKERADERKSD